jgi:hypothetical protein
MKNKTNYCWGITLFSLLISLLIYQAGYSQSGIIDFEQQKWRDIEGVKLYRGGQYNTLIDTENGVDFFIAFGEMYIKHDANASNTFLFYSPIITATDPDITDERGRIVIFFSNLKKRVKLKVTRAGSAVKPVAYLSVTFYKSEDPANPLYIVDATDGPEDVEYSNNTDGIKMVIVNSHFTENSIDNLEFTELGPSVISPPTDLIALDGYDGAIPLAWNKHTGTQLHSSVSLELLKSKDKILLLNKSSYSRLTSSIPSNNLFINSSIPSKNLYKTESAFQSSLMALKGYNVYRSTSSGGIYTKIADNISRQYYRDESVTNGQTYYYKVTAVYNEGESNSSNEVNGQAQTNGNYIASGWATSVPTLDGKINVSEWSQATTTTITYPGYSGTVTLYVMNNDNYLYLAVDDKRDHSLDDWDNFSIIFDKNLDREWPQSSPSNEGLIRLHWDGGSNSAKNVFQGIYGWWPDNLHGDSDITGEGVNQKISLSSGNVQYEGSINLTTSQLSASPGVTIGIVVFSYDVGSSDFGGLWPPQVLQLIPKSTGYGYCHAPYCYADLKLATQEVVTAPDTPSGPSSGKVDQSLTFTTGGSTSNLGHAVQYQFDWGDGTQSSWGSATQSHSYNSAGTKLVKARARCQTHTSVVSVWSGSKSVSISYCSLSTTISPTGTGSVSKNPNKTGYSYNENVQLTAIPNTNYQFDHWGGDLSGSDNPKTVTMNGDKSVTAYFVNISHGHFIFTTTDESYSIVINAATLDGISLATGDEIGLFTPAGLCVGASIWTGSVPLALVAWKDDTQTGTIDGYQVGEVMHFRVWDHSASEEYPAIVTYQVGDGTFGYSLYSIISLLEAQSVTTQTVVLNQGWSWISFNVEATDLNVETIFGSIPQLKILINGAGLFYIPGVINGIGDWNVLEGYKIYVNANDAVTVTGQKVPYNTPIPLNSGWNFVAYLPEVPIPAETALNSIVSKLEIAKQDNGKFFIPNTINTIGNMDVAEGYKIYVNAATTLIYPANGLILTKNEMMSKVSLRDTTFHFTFKDNTGESYSIVIDEATINGQSLEVGDEIGVFTSVGLCVGASVWTGTVPIGLTAWKDDNQTSEVDGYTAGDMMKFRIWDASDDKEYNAVTNYASGDSTFESGFYSHILSLQAIITSVTRSLSQIPNEFFLGQNYPNPFNLETTIEFQLPQAAEVELIIFDLQGHEVQRLVQGIKTAGYHTVQWGGRDEAGQLATSGMYFYKIESKGRGADHYSFIEVKKLILLK